MLHHVDTNRGALRISFERESGPVWVAFGCVSGPSIDTDCLAIAEHKRYDSFVSPSRKISFVNGRLSAKLALAAFVPTPRLSDIDIYNGIMGQPLIRHADYHGFQVSISHTADTGLSLASPEGHPMAVDIERIRPSAEKAIVSQLTAAEVALVTHLAMPAGYSLLWSVRESLSKILKTGLMASASFYEIKDIRSLSEGVFEMSFVHLFQYKAVSFVLDTHVFSVCMPRKSQCESWESLMDLVRSVIPNA
jgi:phosphopantetheinyl transferase